MEIQELNNIIDTKKAEIFSAQIKYVFEKTGLNINDRVLVKRYWVENDEIGIITDFYINETGKIYFKVNKLNKNNSLSNKILMNSCPIEYITKIN